MIKFKNHPTPPELKMLGEFEQSLDSAFLDFEFLEDDDDRLDTLPAEQKEQFLAFAMDGSGSLLAYWFYKKGMDISEAPIAFLGSDGENIVVAKSTKELLGLLCYDTNFFSEASVYSSMYKDDPSSVISPEEAFGGAYFPEMLEGIAEQYPEYQKFRTWIQEKFKITPPENPYNLIMENSSLFPALPALE